MSAAAARLRLRRLRVQLGAAAGGLGIERHVGGVLDSALKLVVKEPTLDNPTAEQISAADRSAQRSDAAARSRRRLIR
jgi:hypothetical protein